MSRSNKIPFPRGKTAFAGQAASDFDTSSLAHLEGQIVYQPDIDPAGDGKTRRSNADIVAKVVRNRHSTVLLPGVSCSWLTAEWGKSVEINTTANTYIAGFVDDHVHATNGVPVNDLFYLIIKGPCTAAAKTSGVATAGGLYKQGGMVYQSSEAGHIEGFTNDYGNLLNDADVTGVPAYNAAGRFSIDTAAVSGITTALIDVDTE